MRIRHVGITLLINRYCESCLSALITTTNATYHANCNFLQTYTSLATVYFAALLIVNFRKTAVFLGMPMPLSTFLMIIICVGSDMIGSLGLIHEYAEADIMRRPPRDSRTERLVNSRTILFAYFFVGIIESCIAFFMYFLPMWLTKRVTPGQLVFAFHKWGTEGWIPHLTPDEQTELNYLGQTAFFVSLVMTQLWNLLAVRTRYQSIFSQKFQTKLFYYMLGEVAVVLCTCYLPIVNRYTYTRPVEYYHFLIPLTLGSLILIGDEIRKFFVRKYPKGILAKLAW